MPSAAGGRERPTSPATAKIVTTYGSISMNSLGTGDPMTESVFCRFEANPNRRLEMGLARVVSFAGVSAEKMAEMQRDMQDSSRPDDVPAKEIVVLHDPVAEKSVVVLFFENEADYQRGDAVLSAMPASDTPGQRTSVEKYEVAFRMTD